FCARRLSNYYAMDY
nr:immunoglobulin heavy chain junction region [Mus musculus]